VTAAATSQESRTTETNPWQRPLLIVLVLLGAALAFFSFRPQLIPPRYATLLVPSLLTGLLGALILHLVTLARAQTEQRRANTAFDVTDREFASVLRNTLDGILILNDHAICLDANPAAFKILGTTSDKLIGQPLSAFYSDTQAFEREWNALRNEGSRCGQANLIRGNGSTAFVDYAFSANCVPGRHLLVLCDTTRRNKAETSLRKTEEQLQEISENVQEIFWKMDAATKEVVYVSKAYETITGRPPSDIRDNPTLYKELIHPEDLPRVLDKLDEAATTGTLDEEFRILRADGALGWIRCTASSVDAADKPVRWLTGVAQDITYRKNAEREVARNLDAAIAAQREADALRDATLTLTQNLRMDAVLDALLATLFDIVPYSSASILLTETDHTFLLARQVPQDAARKKVILVDANENAFLQQVSITRKSVFLENTRQEVEWRDSPAFGSAHAWICVPLVASEQLIGFLSVSSKESGRFTQEHFRFTRALALSAAVAIQNARLYERAEIYAEELQLRLKHLEDHEATSSGEDRHSPGESSH
jgi:PAS domain S-box-containing protein